MKTKFILALAAVMSLVSLAVTPAVASDRRIISEPIIIEEGDSLVLAPGAVVLFTEYAGITVKGHLIARGTADEPIKFASVNDTSGEATPFDWNGIEVTGVGHAALTNVHISGAISAITSEKPRGVMLEDCVFENNGQWNLSVTGEVQEVPNGKPYSYSVAALAPVKTPDASAIDTAENLTTGETAAVTAERKPKPQKMSRVKLGIQIPAAALAIGGIAGEIYYDGKVKTYDEKYNEAVANKNTEAKRSAKQATEKYMTYRNALYIAGAAGLAGFTITFFF